MWASAIPEENPFHFVDAIHFIQPTGTDLSACDQTPTGHPLRSVVGRSSFYLSPERNISKPGLFVSSLAAAA